MYSLSKRSLKNLEGVHPDLVKLVTQSIKCSAVDFVVIEGLRTREKQIKLVNAGASQTLNSRHLTGHAIDVAALIGNEIRWDWPLYAQIATAFAKASADLDIPFEWGGSWKSFRDGPHFQLPKYKYP
jgi:peptidoglycan LD-endopeptidase CwlK